MLVMAPEPFSVLLPVYAGDNAPFLMRAFESITTLQTRPPDEVVIVRDGPVPPPLAACLGELVERAEVPVTVLEVPEHRGLGSALREGMDKCRYDIVARMDADDVSLPERFARQVPLVESGFDLVGSALTEMRGDEADLGDVRRPPLTHARIVRFARFHSPFNHPTVVMRRSAAERAGGYEHLRSFEDYWLWVRMLAGGALAANVEEPLLLYRVRTGAYERRGGSHLVRPEIELQVRMRRLGFISRVQFARNIAVRVSWRLFPLFLRRWLYGLVFRRARDPLPVGDVS
jgi:glycosyltransferase involved in cell wall biosynthesis